jgi:APA family basic amino acid/polyamine antiporter
MKPSSSDSSRGPTHNHDNEDDAYATKRPSSASPSGLVRALGPILGTAIVVGTVIGSGVFKKPQQVALNVDYFGLTIGVWIAGGIFVMLGALTYAEVVVLYPRAGGSYVLLREAYGRLVGFLYGWVDFFVIRSASIAALATIFTESFNDVLKNEALQQTVGLPAGTHLDFWAQRGLTATIIIGLALVNVLGVKWGGVLQLCITLVKVGSLLTIIVLPFAAYAAATADANVPAPDPTLLRPVWPSSVNAIDMKMLVGLGAALLGVQWAYHGWQNIGPVAEEVRHPQRNIPLSLLLGVGIIMALYVGANVAYSLILPRPAMAGMTDTPVVTQFGLTLLGPLGVAAASAAVMCSVFGALNGNLLVGARLPYAMSEDGLAPRALSAVHPRFHTPMIAILVLMTWSVFLVVAAAVGTEVGLLDPKESHFDLMTDFAMFGALIFETLAVLSIFVFRRRYPNAARPYRCIGYPVVPALYILFPLYVLTCVFLGSPMKALVGVGFIGLGALVYYALGLDRKRGHERKAGR